MGGQGLQPCPEFPRMSLTALVSEGPTAFLTVQEAGQPVLAKTLASGLFWGPQSDQGLLEDHVGPGGRLEASMTSSRWSC